jgi:hypothetical protein
MGIHKFQQAGFCIHEAALNTEYDDRSSQRDEGQFLAPGKANRSDTASQTNRY